MWSGSAQWLLAASAAVLLHGSLLLAFHVPSDGAASPPPGPSVEMAESLAGMLGERVEIEAENEAPEVLDPADMPREIARSETVEQVGKPEPLVPARGDPVANPPAREPVEAQSVEIAATAPIDPIEELSVEPIPTAIESREADPMSVVPPPPRDAKIRKQKEQERTEEAERRKHEAEKAADSDQRGDGQRRSARRGTGRTGQTGQRSKSGGSGRASPGAIAAFKSQVRARIADCARSHLSGRGGGRVVIRFGVGSGGSATAVSTSGTASLRGIAAAAAQGCSFPRPPAGAAGMRFSFPATVR